LRFLLIPSAALLRFGGSQSPCAIESAGWMDAAIPRRAVAALGAPGWLTPGNGQP